MSDRPLRTPRSLICTRADEEVYAKARLMNQQADATESRTSLSWVTTLLGCAWLWTR